MQQSFKCKICDRLNDVDFHCLRSIIWCKYCSLYALTNPINESSSEFIDCNKSKSYPHYHFKKSNKVLTLHINESKGSSVLLKEELTPELAKRYYNKLLTYLTYV